VSVIAALWRLAVRMTLIAADIKATDSGGVGFGIGAGAGASAARRAGIVPDAAPVCSSLAATAVTEALGTAL